MRPWTIFPSFAMLGILSGCALRTANTDSVTTEPPAAGRISLRDNAVACLPPFCTPSKPWTPPPFPLFSVDLVTPDATWHTGQNWLWPNGYSFGQTVNGPTLGGIAVTQSADVPIQTLVMLQNADDVRTSLGATWDGFQHTRQLSGVEVPYGVWPPSINSPQTNTLYNADFGATNWDSDVWLGTVHSIRIYDPGTCAYVQPLNTPLAGASKQSLLQLIASGVADKTASQASANVTVATTPYLTGDFAATGGGIGINANGVRPGRYEDWVLTHDVTFTAYQLFDWSLQSGIPALQPSGLGGVTARCDGFNLFDFCIAGKVAGQLDAWAGLVAQGINSQIQSLVAHPVALFPSACNQAADCAASSDATDMQTYIERGSTVAQSRLALTEDERVDIATRSKATTAQASNWVCKSTQADPNGPDVCHFGPQAAVLSVMPDALQIVWVPRNGLSSATPGVAMYLAALGADRMLGGRAEEDALCSLQASLAVQPVRHDFPTATATSNGGSQ